MFFPISSRFVFQSINYVSQPALFFRRTILDESETYLREDMVAAWDYEYVLRMWHHGPAQRIKGEPLSAFRWHDQSISGSNFEAQFKEEYEAARADAGSLSVQNSIHFLVRWGIVGIYSVMSKARSLKT